MLLQRHGASILGKFVPKSIMIPMASTSGPALLVADPTRPTAVLVAQSLSAMARTVHQGQSRIWHPTQEIVFGNSPLPTETSPPAALNTISASNFDRHLPIKPNVADICFIKSSADFSSSEPGHDQSPSQSSLDPDGSSWVPSSASQDSKRGDSDGKDASESEQEFPDGDQEELHTPLAFQIPQDILKRAKDAAPGTRDSFWSYKMYLGPENQEVKVHYCRSKATTERVAQYFLNEAVVGFDIEWKPEATKNSGIKNNVALIQLASETRIALFHVAAFPKDTITDLVAPSMKQIMEDAEITKVGVAIKADCTRLRNYLDIDPRGILELSHLYKLVKYSSSGDENKINKRLVSLTTQAEEHLELPIFKGEVRGSDWTQSLSIDQIKYAASDAYANFMLYDALECKRKRLQPTPPRPYHAELNLPIRLASGTVIAITDDAMDDFEPIKSSTSSSTVPASGLEAAAENIQIEDDSDPSLTNSPVRINAKPKSTDSGSPAPSRPQNLVDAESWAVAHRAANPSVSQSGKWPPPATFSALRVYALWYYNPSLSIPAIASSLRDPPLRHSTIAAYILDSVRLEKLPFERERLKTVLQVIPGSRDISRYKGVWRLVE